MERRSSSSRFGQHGSVTKRRTIIDTSKMTEDEKLAWELQKEEHRRYRKLHAQYGKEMKAKTYGLLAEGQRVSYHHKATGEDYEAVIIDVHLDDGPDRPYYTIKYKRKDVMVEDDGVERDVLIEIEKQTDGDRLTKLPWDEDAAFHALQTKE